MLLTPLTDTAASTLAENESMGTPDFKHVANPWSLTDYPSSSEPWSLEQYHVEA